MRSDAGVGTSAAVPRVGERSARARVGSLACGSMVALVALGGSAVAQAEGAPDWRLLAPGIEYGTIRLVAKPKYGDGRLHVVRIDSARAALSVHMASADVSDAGDNRTAAAWADALKAVAVINAGMYETDHSTHTGYLRADGHTNNPRWVKAYKSALVIDADGRARIDDVPARPAWLAKPPVVVQNLRLIRGPGRNVWSEKGRAWSEAALAMDDEGRILFLFSRTPFSMRRFNRRLLKSKLGIVRAHHLEGGPEASLSVRGPDLKLDFSGSFETGFVENDGNHEQWRLPNVIAVRARRPAKADGSANP